MKRCPQCSFLYLDSDQFCDLDKTPLVADDFGTDVGVIEHSGQEAEKLSLTRAGHQQKLTPGILLAAIVASLIIALMLLLSYQRMHSSLQASQAPPTSQAQASHSSGESPIAQQASSDVSANVAITLPVEADNNTSPSAKPSSSTTAKTTANTRSDSARVRVSANPVSTGDISRPGRGPVTVRLADGSSLQADEVWKTKAGIWYRRKGIVTLVKPNRVRALNH